MNNRSMGGNGGGLVKCDGHIEGNLIQGNGAKYGGGFLLCNAVIRSNTIKSNQGVEVGGAFLSCGGMIEKNVISDNISYFWGAAFEDCSGTVRNNIITGNRSHEGNFIDSCTADFENNTIYGNSQGVVGSSGVIKNCIMWANESPIVTRLVSSPGPSKFLSLSTSVSLPTYCCIENWTGGGEGNTSLNPDLRDPEKGDFHLKWSSPCVDAGGVIAGLVNDFDGNKRPCAALPEARGDGSHFDIGAYEFIEVNNSVKSWLLY